MRFENSSVLRITISAIDADRDFGDDRSSRVKRLQAFRNEVLVPGAPCATASHADSTRYIETDTRPGGSAVRNDLEASGPCDYGTGRGHLSGTRGGMVGPRRQANVKLTGTKRTI
jgi:hypothetical protein